MSCQQNLLHKRNAKPILDLSPHGMIKNLKDHKHKVMRLEKKWIKYKLEGKLVSL